MQSFRLIAFASPVLGTGERRVEVEVDQLVGECEAQTLDRALEKTDSMLPPSWLVDDYTWKPCAPRRVGAAKPTEVANPKGKGYQSEELKVESVGELTSKRIE